MSAATLEAARRDAIARDEAAREEVRRYGATPDGLAEVQRSGFAWRRYHEVVSPPRPAAPGSPAADFAARRYLIGALTPGTLAELTAAIDAAPYRTFGLDWCARGFLANAHTPEMLERINRDHLWYDLGARQLWAVWALLEEVAAPVAAALGRPWAFLGVRAWRTRRETESDMNSWHTDGCPPEAIKLMAYLTEIGGDGGGIAFRDDAGVETHVRGAAGAWVLFQNSGIVHRGVAPSNPDRHRVVVEVTLGPAPRMDLRPRFFGANMRHAHNPWSEPAFDPR